MSDGSDGLKLRNGTCFSVSTEIVHLGVVLVVDDMQDSEGVHLVFSKEHSAFSSITFSFQGGAIW